MRVVRVDGSARAVAALSAALRDVLAGGPTVVPLGPADAEPDPAGVPDRGHVVVTTSGSTGAPKRVLLGAGALLASARATQRRLGGPAPWALALPAQHVAGLQVLVRSVVAGTDPALGLADLPAGAATSLVPTQLLRLLDTDPSPLTRCAAVLLGGAAAPPGLVERARAAGARVVTTYGMTETSGGCVYDGVPLDGVRVRLGDGGRVEIAGPVLATGYVGGPAIGGWFATSDLGRLDADGRLHVLGRLDDVVVTGGVNVAPAEVEAVLAGLPGVGQVCVVGVPDREWGERLVAAVVPDGPVDPSALLAAARRRLDGPRTPKEVVLLDELPLRGVGKPDRRAVRDAVSHRTRRP